MNKRKLVITGFMGTGKTTLAQALAKETGLKMVDTDEIIIERAGLTVPEIFAQMGEAGFRAWEAAVCADVMQDDAIQIIATGGGAFLNASNRQAFQEATQICLTANPTTIYHRLAEDTARPLLQSENPQARIQELLKSRETIYQSIRWQVDTSALAIDDLVQQILGIWEQDSTIREPEIRVQTPDGSYPILFDEGLLDNIVDILNVYGLGDRRTVVITDSNVVSLYGEALVGKLPNAALSVMTAGEPYKNLESVTRLLDSVARHKLDRSGLIIALGGGVVGDTAGYVAASYMRGVRLVQIPTTLLSMVDSSVGGKVGVDIPMGKNLVGAFKQPDLVLIDPTVLETLSDEEFRSGMAEVIKSGFIANPELLNPDMPLLEKIRKTVQVKIDIVQRDPFEHGERAFLNLGHTFGHAIERVSDYTWRHGDAVGVGLIGAALLSQKLMLVNADMVKKVKDIVRETGLPSYYRHYLPENIYDAMALDKKWKDGRSHFIVLQDIGQPAIVRDVPREMVVSILEELKA